jgi:pseudouridine-5'-phosphate glycosidase
VRAAGAVPAGVALLDGRIRIGLAEGELERLAREPAAKCGARDLAGCLAGGGNAGTTVSATARLAALCGIRVFATGGIGGVHRRPPDQPEAPADVSADLPELARSPVAVICAGAKSILDLPATLEMLETLGVPVLGAGTDCFPAFYAADSGLSVAQRLDAVGALAAAAQAHWALGGAGLLVCQPPPEADALAAAELETMTGEALVRAVREGVRGGAVTPFVLAELRRLSGGRTLAVNRSLVTANAALGGRLAVALAVAD